jgi:hypothetical protein
MNCPPFGGFFNKCTSFSLLFSISCTNLELALGIQMFDMMQTSYADVTSPEVVVEITVRTSNSSSDLQLRGMEGDLLHPIADHLREYFDQKIWQFCILNISCKRATTNLIPSALYGRAYLMFLSPYDVMEGERNFRNGTQFISFVFSRIHESISEVVDGFNKDHGRDDKRYWSEAATAVAILYYGLQHAQEVLEDPDTQPICVSYFLIHHKFHNTDLCRMIHNWYVFWSRQSSPPWHTSQTCFILNI